MLSGDRIISESTKYTTIDHGSSDDGIYMTPTHLDVSENKVDIIDVFCHVWSHAMSSMKDQSDIWKIVRDSDCAFVLIWECQSVAGCGENCNPVAALP